jgi:O-antigen ligase
LGFHLDRPLGIGLYAGCFIVFLLGTTRLWWHAGGKWTLPARIGGLAALLLYAQVLISAQNRTTYLALVVALAVLAILLAVQAAQRREGFALRRLGMAGLLVAAGLATLAGANLGAIEKRLGAESDVIARLEMGGLDAAPASSITTRLRLWRFASDGVAEAPLLGHGLGSMVEVIEARLRPEGPLMVGERYDHVHNSYLQLLWSQGLLGALLWAGLLAALLRDLLRAARTEPRIRELLPTIAAGLAFIAVWAMFDYRLSHVDTRMFALLCLLSLRQLGTAARATTAGAQLQT